MSNWLRTYRAQRLMAWTAAPAMLLLVPMIAMQLTDQVRWNGFDFLVAAIILCGAGFGYALLTSAMKAHFKKVLVGVAVLVCVGAFWVSAI